MGQTESRFTEIIQADRDSRERHEWRGKLLDYLDLLRENPRLAERAQAHSKGKGFPPRREGFTEFQRQGRGLNKLWEE
jgi:hypothetical protein